MTPAFRIFVSGILLVFLVAASHAQSVISVHPLVDTSRTDIRQAVAVWSAYLRTQPDRTRPDRTRPDSIRHSPFWNEAEQAQSPRFDLLEREFEPTLYRGYPVQILSVVGYPDGFYQIKSLFGGNNPKSRSPIVFCIANVYARPDSNGRWLLYNALPINRSRFWNSQQLGAVTYYFPPYHTFNKQKARQLNGFIDNLCQQFGVPAKPVEYYLADTPDELRQLRGFDYQITGSGLLKPTGRAIDNRVFCSGLDEFYPHELVHVYVDPHYLNKHPWVTEGVATFLGGSRGESLDWHLARVAAHLRTYPTIDLTSMLSLVTLDEFTDYRYALGGLFARAVFKKGGLPLLKQFMQSGQTDTAYYAALEQFLGLKRSQLNTSVRELLAGF
ncbi:hypothetical protein J2I47_21070 [Fibrella sp. HMF5335]|uniref:Peptidase MA superfamily protein n=1 Tax=Fibrella rubiginis TaxID=2817060 RepID=A0A939GKQ2_9BACT|nr:hypothetical protein [Fibrella rubiginis]MBO0939059.1 hypothetical protein [Fibrella rubiginis]